MREMGPESEVVRATRAYVCVCARLRTAPRASELSSLLDAERTQFTRVFRGRTGICLRDWLHAWKVALAEVLLRATALPLNEVAQIAGYGSARNFRRSFRNATSLSPNEYRAGTHEWLSPVSREDAERLLCEAHRLSP